MTPDKTGAVLFIKPYGVFCRADAFELFGVMCFRITTASINREVIQPDFRINNWAEWFDRDAVVSTMFCAPLGDYERLTDD